MSTLLIDVGNTRAKWAWLNKQQLIDHRAEAHAGWTCDIAREKLGGTKHIPERILVSNVAGPALAKVLTEASEDLWALTPTFIRSSAKFADIINGYKRPEQLGVDRWLGVIAAYHLDRRACCVVSVGTAMTVDAVDDSGRHLGGVIVPGPSLMEKSLFVNTSDIFTRVLDGSPGLDLFADNTQAAVYQGIAHSLAATVERAHSALQQRTGSNPDIFLTGGARDVVAGALRIPFRVVDDLVLRGLAEIAGESAKREL